LVIDVTNLKGGSVGDAYLYRRRKPAARRGATGGGGVGDVNAAVADNGDDDNDADGDDDGDGSGNDDGDAVAFVSLLGLPGMNRIKMKRRSVTVVLLHGTHTSIHPLFTQE
jgi:hypothetical protein